MLDYFFSGSLVSETLAMQRDIAPLEHGDGRYRTVIPFRAVAGPMYIKLQPKRFCFEEPDRNVFAYAPPRLVAVDVARQCR